ncbi:MAG TPA: P1 family peptidase [Steroidobacteraceae bacterium]|nr:P1 family peptidase [Steroidobacteraceae bacterium]
MKKNAASLAILLLMMATAQAAPRARELGIPFDGQPGPLNAITDVAGVAVGHTTLISSADPQHEVRTGVTAILPRGRSSVDKKVFGAWFSLNGNGEMTGTAWLEESGLLDGPVMLTNTHSVGLVRDAVIAWRVRAGHGDVDGYWWSLPVVAETWDGYLNDINGFHVRPEHVDAAIAAAQGGPVAEGNVGGGTGMICHEFKGGIGTSSRQVRIEGKLYTVGVLVQANYGVRDTLRIAGVPVGQHLRQQRIYTDEKLAGDFFHKRKAKAVSPILAREREGEMDAALKPEISRGREMGSIIIVVATDAPLLPHQLKRIARRATMGLARNGSYSGNGSGDLFVAFSTANPDAAQTNVVNTATYLGEDLLDDLFRATVEGTEEAIVNALVAARDMRGQDGHLVLAIPHEELRAVLKQYNRLQEK